MYKLLLVVLSISFCACSVQAASDLQCYLCGNSTACKDPFTFSGNTTDVLLTTCIDYPPVFNHGDTEFMCGKAKFSDGQVVRSCIPYADEFVPKENCGPYADCYFCDGHLCNSAPITASIGILSILLLFVINYLK